MTNPSPDWLDDVLRSRPVDDDGFSARVTGLGRGEVRTLEVDHVALRAALEREASAQAGSYASADLKEGLAALRERRPPRFAG